MSMQKGKHQGGQQSQGYTQPRFSNPQSHATYQRPQSQQRPDVGFHVAASGFAGPQPGGPNGPPGGIPNMPRGIHHPGHHGVPPGPGNPSLPPQGSSGGPGQQGGQQGGQQSQNQGPQGPTPTSTPPGDMGKQPPQHLQQQPPTQMPPGVIYGVGVGNQPRPPNAQTYYRGQGGPAPRLSGHRNQMVNIQPTHIGQQMFQHQVQMQSLPQMYTNPAVPQMQQQMFVAHGQMPIYGGQPRHQNHTNAAYFTQPTHQPILMAQHPLYTTGYPPQHAQAQPGPFYYQASAPVSMQRPGGGVPGGQGPQMAQPQTQQVVQGGPPAQQMGQATVPMAMVAAGPPQGATSSVAPQGVPPASNRASSGVRRKFALDIVDPKTMKSINSEIYEAGGPGASQDSAANSPPGSEDSSARQTPQPSQGSDSSAMDVIADFAARVAKVASEDSSTHPLVTTFSEGSSPSPSRELMAGNPSEAISIKESLEESSKPIVAVDENQWKSSLPKHTSSKSELTKDNETLTKLDNADHNSSKVSEVERVFPKEFVPQSAIPKLEVCRDPVVESKPAPVVIKKESLLENSSTPVVSANADTPAITLVHKNKTADPSLKSSNQVSLSPRKKPTPKEAAAAPLPVVEAKVSSTEKSSVLQTTVQLVPTVALTTSQESKPPKKEEFAVPQAPAKDRGNAKKDKGMRGRKSSLSRDRGDKNSRSSTERKTSGSRDRETINRKNSSSLSREREAADKRDKTPRPKEAGKPKKETETPEREVASTPPPVVPVVTAADDMKQANGEVDAADGKVPKQHQQNAKAVKKGKMRDRKPGTDKEPAEIEVVSAPEVEVVAPTPAPPTVVSEPVVVAPVIEPVLPPEPEPSAPSPVPKEEEVDEEQIEREESDKMVLARNEENAKVTAALLAEDAPPVIENVPATEPKVPPPFRKTLSYKDDQWSPVNLEGKKKYDRDFLMELKEDPQSKKKPDNLPDMEVVLKDNANNRQQPRGMADQRPVANRNQGAEAFTPTFMRTGGSNSRGPVTKRNSQQGKPVNKSGKPNVIHMSLSLREDVKLHETENAWKPDVMKRTTGVVATVEGDPTEELYRSVRGVLNKLTPQKFDTLVSQVQALPIDNKDKLNGVINLVFLKAVDEPGFSVAYAQMCKVLSDMQVPAERKTPNDPPHVNFRKLIVNRCQSEFEKNNEDELNKDARFKEIELEADAEKKKELLVAYEEEERRIRMKSVGNIRFIGELFKLKMLTTNIMHRCIAHLLRGGDEESLECLCKLLTTIGKDLESKTGAPAQNDLGPYFNKMKEIAGKRGQGSVSSRVRFMLQDVIELRQCKWVPRRDDANPKTMDQIQKEAERETMDMHIALSQQPPQTPRRQDDRGNMGDRRGGGGGKNSRGDSGQQMVDGWTSVNRTGRNLVVDSSKIKVVKGQTEIDNNMSLGSGSQFNKWARGAGGPTKSEEKKPSSQNNNNNLYNVLQETDYSSQGGKTAPTASMEKERMLASFKTFTADASAAHSSRSSSLQQTSSPSSRDSSSLRGGGSTSMGSQPNSVSASTEDISRAASEKPKCPELDQDDVNKWATLIVGELLTSNILPDCAQTVQEKFPHTQMHKFVCECLNLTLEKSAQNRLSVGKFMVYLIQSSIMKKEHYLEGLKEFLISADDIEIDVPKIWLYLAETIVPLLISELLSFAEFRESVWTVKKGSQIVKDALSLVSKEVGPNWIKERMEKSNLAWTDVMEPGLVDEFIKSLKLGSTVGGSSTGQSTSSSSVLSTEEIRQKVVSFLSGDSTTAASSFDQVCDWIAANVGDRVGDHSFIRALMTAICESAIYRNDQNTPWRLREGVLSRHHKLLQKYVDAKEEYEIQCLYAIQALINKLEHPQGLCCTIFQDLLDNNILSSDAFLSWEDSNNPAEQVGKGVALKSLTSFYTALKESISSGDES